VFYVVLLAMIAGFLAMRLYAVLGKKTGHEQALPKPAEERIAGASSPRAVELLPEAREAVLTPAEVKAQAGLRAIAAVEPFDTLQFLEGSKSAYKMILEAYWKGDEETLAWLTEDEVHASFAEAIAMRMQLGHVLDNRLVAIERATIVEAALNGRDARIAVRFDADIASVTRDAEGVMIAGSMTDAVETHDVWTFARTLKSGDANWKLADTDEA